MEKPLVGQLLKRIMQIVTSNVFILWITGITTITGCSSPPVPEQTQAVQALTAMKISATTQDSVTFSIEGITSNEQLELARPHLSILNTHYKLNMDLRGATFTNLAFLSGLANITTLNLSGNSGLIDLMDFPALPNLRSVNLSRNKTLTHFKGALNLPNLQTLNLSSNPNLTDISGLTSLPNLQTLDLSGNGSIEAGQYTLLSSLSALRTLNLSDTDLEDLTDFPSLPQLKSLDLSYNKLTRLNGLSQLNNLENLDLSHNNTISNFKVLVELPNLRTVNLYTSNVKQADLDMIQKARPGLTIEK